MQNKIPSPIQNEVCERCGVAHMQNCDPNELVFMNALETIGEAENKEWRALGVDATALEMFEGDTLAGEALQIISEQEAAMRERFKLFPHQQATMDWIKEQVRVKRMIDPKLPLDYEADELNFHPVIVGGDFFDTARMTAQIPRDHSSGIVMGLSEGVFPYQGITRGPRMSCRGGNLSQIPKTPEAQKLFRESMDGEYIPKAGSDARIMFMVDSISPMDMTRTFIHEAYHAETFLENQFASARRCGKTRTSMALHEYESKHALHAYVDGEPGRPKGCKAKRKAAKAARKASRKGTGKCKK